jgi:hypothetical protein
VRTGFTRPWKYEIRLYDEAQGQYKENELRLTEQEADELTDDLIYLRLIRDLPDVVAEDGSSEMTANFVFPFSEVVKTGEHRVQNHFCQWLISRGWFVRARFVGRGQDIIAKFDDEERAMIVTYIIECKADKGRRTGEHIDNAYGQLLRRISRNTPRDGRAINVDVYYALVIEKTEACIKAARRVSQALRDLLRITVFAVDGDGAVYEMTDNVLVRR